MSIYLEFNASLSLEEILLGWLAQLLLKIPRRVVIYLGRNDGRRIPTYNTL